MTEQVIDNPALHEARVNLLRRLASVSKDNGTNYDAYAFLAARAVFGEMVTVDSWRSWGGQARRSVLDNIEPGQGWFTDLDRQRERADSLRTAIRDYQRSAQQYQDNAAEYRRTGQTMYVRDYENYAATADREVSRLQGLLDELIKANPLLAAPSDVRKDPVPLPPEQATTDVEEEEDEHEHEPDEDGENPACVECGGSPDSWCNHDHKCTRCDDCEHEHDCQHCGLDPQCEHRFTYTCSCGESGVEYVE